MDHRTSSRSRRAEPETLPPHDEAAEEALLACVLQDPIAVLPQVRERLEGEQPFFVLKHDRLLRAMCEVSDRGHAVDAVTLKAELGSELDGMGGLGWLAGLPEKAPSASSWPSYLQIVWDKYLARQLIQGAQRTVAAVTATEGVTETLLGQIEREREEFLQKTQRGNVTPRHLKPAEEFAEEAWEHFFGASRGEAPGMELPLPFPLRIRRQETTLVFGDDGSGKSTLLNYFGLHLVNEPKQKLVIASFEMPPPVTLWIMASQLIGRKALEDNKASRSLAADAIGWLQQRVIFYDFLGIGDWREVLDTFRYASEKQGATLGIVDSVMRIGIPDDDYAQQGFAAAAFAQHAMKSGMHLFYVIHENKGDGKGKAKIRGSKLWSANAHNVLRIARNEDKGAKVDKLKFDIATEKARPQPDQAAIRDDERELLKTEQLWDSQIVLQKQRYPGTRQNGSKFIWFDHNCFQFRDQFQAAPVNWLQRWRRRGLETPAIDVDAAVME